MIGFLNTSLKEQCQGCEACCQICPKDALTMAPDNEGFRYPVLDESRCIHCNLCHKVCPEEAAAVKYDDKQIAFGGYNLNNHILQNSTSGGAFSAIVDSWCDENYIIFGAIADGLSVHHAYINDKAMVNNFRKSKYSQSNIRKTYKEAADFLKQGKKVLFSGTPCQIGALNNFLSIKKINTDNLLTVEVVCEGVPSPLYIRKMDDYFEHKFGSRIATIDYRYKDISRWDFELMKIVLKDKGKWDFQIMCCNAKKGGGIFKKDRWFNPFWSIWLNHLMSRPSCYHCPYTTPNRVADITLGDLWGVHLYCPELYGQNGGSSLIVANSLKGKAALNNAKKMMFGHALRFADALKYQSPMRKPISMNPDRSAFMKDLQNPDITYKQLNSKWSKKPSVKLLFSKYIWGNRQKVALWNFKQKYFNRNSKTSE